MRIYVQLAPSDLYGHREYLNLNCLLGCSQPEESPNWHPGYFSEAELLCPVRFDGAWCKNKDLQPQKWRAMHYMLSCCSKWHPTSEM